MSIGERILERLDEMDMTQKQLSKKVNISYSTLNGYIKTTRQPDFETLKNIARELGVSCDYLLDFSYDRNKDVTLEEYKLINDVRKITPNQKELIVEQLKIMKRQNI